MFMVIASRKPIIIIRLRGLVSNWLKQMNGRELRKMESKQSSKVSAHESRLQDAQKD
jgi:hypothetical protein